ncbi:hypothetical protein M2175_004198 [Bradyrhizobium elkanii]|nr:hypothetical protein [Bradyrhizobium elkanii]MCS3969723.1 hypothetical protein [Bradyrhizobium japonicum]
MPEDESYKLSPQAQRYAASLLLDCADLFYELRDRMPISYAATFLRIATTQGLTVAELAARQSVSGAVMSRHLGELGGRTRQGGAGLGLVAVVQRIHGDRREHRVILTEKGVELARRVNIAARGGGPWAQRLRKRA